MELNIRTGVAIAANFLVMAVLIAYSFRWFATYFSSGRWAKNITGLLAGMGLILLAAALMLTPQNARVLLLVAQTKTYLVLLVASNALLLAAIAAFGIINYWRPLRLKWQQNIENELKSELPKIP
jgi:hypothetical protein